jgi:hypothetical protein
MWVSRLAFLLVSASLAVGQDTTFVKSLVLARPFAGCYELHVPDWNAADTKANDLLPTRFQLTMRLESLSGGKAFVAQNLDPKVHYEMIFAFWKPNPDGTLVR